MNDPRTYSLSPEIPSMKIGFTMAIQFRGRPQGITKSKDRPNDLEISQDITESKGCQTNLGTHQAQQKVEKILRKSEISKLFRKLWRKVTDDNDLILYGFRKFRTIHLFNIRFLEEEIDKFDHQVYQTGRKLGYSPGIIDKLGLKGWKKDVNAREVNEVIDQELALKLRELLKQYGIYGIHES